MVMRVYFEKPRTTVGWKGYINDPRLDGSFRINEGLRAARGAAAGADARWACRRHRVPGPAEPAVHRRPDRWGAIGARTTESQSHRQLASGLSCPVGFKNGTDGGVQVAADALVAARAPHAFMGMTKMGRPRSSRPAATTTATSSCAAARRPTTTPRTWPPAARRCWRTACAEQVMIDVSHGNSSKQHQRQIVVAEDVAAQIAGGERRITGLMIESHLEEGRQDLKPGVPLKHGVSITDASASGRARCRSGRRAPRRRCRPGSAARCRATAVSASCSWRRSSIQAAQRKTRRGGSRAAPEGGRRRRKAGCRHAVSGSDLR
jgi:3-deoxy-7-phosphoheptulonate synthase